MFTVCPGIPAQSAPIDGIPLSASDPHNWDTGAAYSYIQALPTHLNSTYADPTSNAFAQFPDQSNALSGNSSVTPTQLDPANPSVNTPFANYNFAVARVRVNGTANTTTTSNVRVLFRLFATQTSDTDYNTLTYASTLDADQQPLAPTLGSGDVTIPFFATGNYEANSDFGVNTDYSGTSSINNQPVTIGGSGESFAYYGCYLNIYPTGNTVTTSAGKQAVQALLPSTHSCVVAQLVYDEAPYPTGSGVVLGPEWSANFAQRNLQITYSDNPGPAATHLVPQTFDVRPSQAPGSGPLENYPDELMVDWGNAPPGSQASIYWPAVASSDVLALADKFYSTHQLSASDAHTIACTVPQGIASSRSQEVAAKTLPACSSVQLPTGVSAGQAYTILVRRISTQAGAPPPRRRRPRHKFRDGAANQACTGNTGRSSPGYAQLALRRRNLCHTHSGHHREGHATGRGEHLFDLELGACRNWPPRTAGFRCWNATSAISRQRSPRRSWLGLRSRGERGSVKLRILWRQARFLKRQLSLPVSTISQ